MTQAPDPRELAVELVVSSSRLIRLAARESPSSVPRALARALAVIRDLGEPRISDIAAADRISQPTATTLVQKLEERGWVERAADPDDARAVRVRITPAGRVAQTEFRQAAADALAPRLGELSADDLASLHDGVRVLTSLLDHQPAPQEEPA
ncbi:MarR family winged helix-turn-helix transcriptional regulator [Angustibacter peucedani]